MGTVVAMANSANSFDSSATRGKIEKIVYSAGVRQPRLSKHNAEHQNGEKHGDGNQNDSWSTRMTTPAICIAPASAARPLQGAGAGTPTQEAANVGITNRIEKPTPARPPKSRCRPTSGSPKRPSSARHHAMRALGPETADVRLTRDVEIQTRRRDTTRANAALRASSRFGRAHFTLQRLFTASKILLRHGGCGCVGP